MGRIFAFAPISNCTSWYAGLENHRGRRSPKRCRRKRKEELYGHTVKESENEPQFIIMQWLEKQTFLSCCSSMTVAKSCPNYLLNTVKMCSFIWSTREKKTFIIQRYRSFLLSNNRDTHLHFKPTVHGATPQPVAVWLHRVDAKLPTLI